MEAHSTTPWVLTGAALLAVLLLSSFGAFSALELTQRVRDASPTRRRWLLAGGGLGLGSALWAGHHLALAGAQQAIRLGYGGPLSLASWAIAVAGGIWALTLVLGPRDSSRWRAERAAGVLTVALVASEQFNLHDLALAPGVVWQPAWAAAAAAATVVGMGFALRYVDRGTPRYGRRGRAVAAAMLGLAITLGHAGLLRGAPILSWAVSLNEGNVPAQSLRLLAGVGTPLLLAALLVLAIVKAGLRRALATATAAIEAAERTDPLTGLPNRVAFERQLDAAARAVDARQGSMAMLFISLDDFKPVNDSFGRAVGDRVLGQIAGRLRELVTPRLALARVGGDDFALLHTGDLPADAVAALARRALDAVARTSHVDGREIIVSCSIGMVQYPRHGSWSTMLVHGEAAAQTVKKSGGGAAAHFESHMLAGAREHVELLRDLRQAIAGHQFELHYQPKIDVSSGEITGAEALLRWQHPKRGLVSPGLFVPLAERHGLIVPIGHWLIDEACRQLRTWRDEGLRMRVSINLSVIQLRQPDLPQRIGEALERHRIDPQQLTCEITESLAMEDSAAMARFFDGLETIGVRISIDDFGTGYSNLSYLRKLPAEELKIDRSFVIDVEHSADARAVVDAVVRLAHALSLKVVAEGVETEGQQNTLRELGCDELQGYLFAKPMAARALALWASTSVGPTALAFRDSLFSTTSSETL